MCLIINYLTLNLLYPITYRVFIPLIMIQFPEKGGLGAHQF